MGRSWRLPPELPTGSTEERWHPATKSSLFKPTLHLRTMLFRENGVCDIGSLFMIHVKRGMQDQCYIKRYRLRRGNCRNHSLVLICVMLMVFSCKIYLVDVAICRC